jgi:hypothetical protein
LKIVKKIKFIATEKALKGMNIISYLVSCLRQSFLLTETPKRQTLDDQQVLLCVVDKFVGVNVDVCSTAIKAIAARKNLASVNIIDVIDERNAVYSCELAVCTLQMITALKRVKLHMSCEDSSIGCGEHTTLIHTLIYSSEAVFLSHGNGGYVMFVALLIKPYTQLTYALLIN